ncbi:MAG: type VI secretion system tip protein VgrG [Alphaproteobacteria bacterium]|nr:type VI secretion system tip protein VgrG [Alphaproteobacteria bacterium]
MRITQENRTLKMESPLGEDQLVLMGLGGEERVNDLFEFQLDLLSPNMDIRPAQILGKPVSFSVRAGTKTRFFSGIVSRFVAGAATEGDHRTYRAEVVPELWLLTQRIDCRIFQNQTAPDIIQKVLQEAGLPPFEPVGLAGHPELEYCVQYLETDFAFISRLMEDAGIVYFFKHAQGSHKLILTDKTSAYFKIEEPNIELRGGTVSLTAVSSWQQQHRFLPNRWAHHDYDFQVPTKNLLADTRSVVSLERSGSFEIFDWRGEYTEKARGRSLAKTRMEALESGFTIVEGGGACRFFAPGGKFTMTFHEIDAEVGKTWVVASVYHSATDLSHQTNSPAPSYANNFACVPEDVLLRSTRKTRRPIIPGPQTAFVVGPAGEEIFTDKFGRIRVQFHWDRRGKKDEKSSCWIRVAQSWAGKKWGMAFTPRIGMEVVVEFLDGDPDQPIVAGCVFNGDNMPHWAAQGSATQSGLKTRSSQGGGDDNANLLRFEDKTGSEEIYFHAEKDFTRVVENDDTLDVGNDQSEKIKRNRSVEVTLGNDTLKVPLGMCKIEAGIMIELKVGTSTLTVDQTGIRLNGLLISVQGTTAVITQAPMITENASGMLILHGGIMLIG